jgi:hypothetical protein
LHQSPSSEVNSCLVYQEIPKLLWNHIHRSSPLHPILCQMNPIYILKPSFFKIHINIILPSMLRSPKCSLHFRFSN